MSSKKKDGFWFDKTASRVVQENVFDPLMFQSGKMISQLAACSPDLPVKLAFRPSRLWMVSNHPALIALKTGRLNIDLTELGDSA
jgi:hypothetical protein